MVIICKKRKILTSELLQNLEEAVSKCTSCKSTGKPLQVRKVSLTKFLKTFNESIQLDFMWIKALTEDPILQIRDRSTGFRNAIIAPSKEMDVAARLLQVHWINQHGPPIEVSADPEFNNDDFVLVLKTYCTKFNATPARRHSKTGCVESGNTTLRVITERLLKDAQYYKNLKGLNYTEHEILSKAVFLTNVLHGQKNCSAFELARGYLPALSGLPQMPLNKDFLDAHQEQVVRRAISKLLRSRVPQTIASSLLNKGQAIYFHEKKTKKAIWDIGFVQDAREHYVVVSRSKKARGKLLKIAYEDIRMVPETSLLYELEKLDLDLGSGDEDSTDDNVDSNEVLNEQGPSSRDLNEQGSPDTSNTYPADILEKPDDDEAVSREARLWASHPSSSSYFTSNADVQYRCEKLGPVLDVGKPSSLSKDIGETPLTNPQVLPTELESVEQTVLRQLRDSVGDKPVTESQLLPAPRWIIDKAIQKEKENFFEKKAYEEVNIRDLPRNANLISSHHFFQIKTDGSPDRLRMRCRLVPHGNKDRDKDSIRKHSTTAQFPVIRALLSAAVIFGFRLGTIDISGAYLQAGPLNRDVFVRLPRGWTKSPFVVWRLLVPSYGLVESGRLWQITVEYWMEQVYGTETIIGFVQLFVVRKEGQIVLIIAKVVDDFLIAGKVDEIRIFHDQISKRFKVGRFICDKDLIFNRLNIHQEPDGSIQISMDEYFSKISSLDIDRNRRKQQDDSCTQQERLAFLALAGQLNWLGHGTLPQASYIASLLQQWTADLKVHHLIEANKALHELRKLKPILNYNSFSEAELSSSESSILAFTDASHGKRSYGQTGYPRRNLPFPKSILSPHRLAQFQARKSFLLSCWR